MDLKVKFGKLKDRYPAPAKNPKGDDLDASFMDDTSDGADPSQDDSAGDDSDSKMKSPFAGDETGPEEHKELAGMPDDILQKELEKRGFKVVKPDGAGAGDAAAPAPDDSSSDDIFG